MKYLHLVCCTHVSNDNKSYGKKSESYWFGFIPVKYLYVHSCVLAVITYRKIDKKQRVNKENVLLNK